jgi:sensor histidine kinase regulating citrate/malate metabolism
LLNAASSAACVLNKDGSVAISNQAAKDLFDLYPGYTIELKIPDIWVAVENVLNNVESRTSFAFFHRNSNYLAEIGPIVWQSHVYGALCILRDVTEIEKTKLSLQSQSHQLGTRCDHYGFNARPVDLRWQCESPSHKPCL